MNQFSKTEKELIISILSTSFQNNKSVLYTIKNGQEKNKYIKCLMDYAFYEGEKQKGVLISKNNQGAAIFIYPNRKKIFNLSSLIESVKVVLNAFGVAGIRKVLRREEYIKSLHPQNDFLYLWFIGVVPAEQGKGTGSLLLNELIKIADEQKIPVYLETSLIENLPFYKKHGFEVYHEWLDDQSGILLYFLRNH